jgi:hypothetical protein
MYVAVEMRLMLGLLILIAYLTGLAIFLEALFREKSV